MTIRENTPPFSNIKPYLLTKEHFTDRGELLVLFKQLLQQTDKTSTFKYNNRNVTSSLVTRHDLDHTLRVWIKMRNTKILTKSLPPSIDKFLNLATKTILGKLNKGEYLKKYTAENIYLDALVNTYGEECAIFANQHGIDKTLRHLYFLSNIPESSEQWENIYYHLFKIPEMFNITREDFSEIKSTILEILYTKLDFIFSYGKPTLEKLIDDWYDFYSNIRYNKDDIDRYFSSYFKDAANKRDSHLLLYCINVCAFLYMLLLTNNYQNLNNDEEKENFSEESEEGFRDIFFGPEKKINPLTHMKRKILSRGASIKKRRKFS